MTQNSPQHMSSDCTVRYYHVSANQRVAEPRIHDLKTLLGLAPQAQDGECGLSWNAGGIA